MIRNIQNNGQWEFSEAKSVMKFVHTLCPEVIYVIKTGFHDKFIVVHEDAHEMVIGNSFVGSQEEVENKYEIKLWK